MLLPMQAKQFEVSAAKNCATLSEAKKWQANYYNMAKIFMSYNFHNKNFIRNHRFRDTNGNTFSCPLDLRSYSNFEFENFEILKVTNGNATL